MDSDAHTGFGALLQRSDGESPPNFVTIMGSKLLPATTISPYLFFWQAAGALDGTPHVTNAVATRKCELLRIEAKLIKEALLAEPQAALALVNVLTRRL